MANYDYLVTTHLEDLPVNRQIVMVDGTVPNWQKGKRDLHFDHHRPGGEPVQILEIPEDTEIQDRACFTTTQVDADACVAAAWLQLLNMDLSLDIIESAKPLLLAIAYDCDHWGLPPGYDCDRWGLTPRLFAQLDEFARNAVATLHESSRQQIIADYGFPPDRDTWSADQKKAYASHCFAVGSKWLVDAAIGYRKWPGQEGEAQAYWDAFEAEKTEIYNRCRMYKNVGILDERGRSRKVDPRHLIQWVRRQEGHVNVTLAVRDRLLELFHTEEELILFKEGLTDSGTSFKLTVPGYNYTLSSVPLHSSGSPRFSDRDIWKQLDTKESDKRYFLGFPESTTLWGGRNEVGGSAWNDAAILCPEEVVDTVLSWLESQKDC